MKTFPELFDAMNGLEAVKYQGADKRGGPRVAPRFRKAFRKRSKSFPKVFRKLSGSFLGAFLKRFGSFPEIFRKLSESFPEAFRKFSPLRVPPLIRALKERFWKASFS